MIKIIKFYQRKEKANLKILTIILNTFLRTKILLINLIVIYFQKSLIMTFLDIKKIKMENVKDKILIDFLKVKVFLVKPKVSKNQEFNKILISLIPNWKMLYSN